MLILYYSDSARETAAVIRDALRETYEPDERVSALNVIRKLEGMSEAEFENYAEESGALL